MSPSGVGQVRTGRRLWLVPRLAWTLLYGEIPDGLHVCHRCDNPPCWNPAHLFLGTRQDNMRDMAAKARGNTVRLTAALVRDIRRRYVPGVTRQRELAGEYGISQKTLWGIVHDHHWRDI